MLTELLHVLQEGDMGQRWLSAGGLLAMSAGYAGVWVFFSRILHVRGSCSCNAANLGDVSSERRSQQQD